jgi:hypothetical protein
MRRESQLVSQLDTRGVSEKCFYCPALRGHEHAKGCVIRVRTVVVEATFTMLHEVPEDWDEQSVDFFVGESDCGNNAVSRLVRLRDGIDNRRCMCNQTSGRFVREATEEDEREFGPGAAPIDEE